MDYLKIHNRFVDYFKSTTPIDRLFNRNPDDERLKNDKIYTEKHHIIPRHSNGSNDSNNLVEVLPEEHLFMHSLRFQCFKDKNDIFAIRCMLNGFMGDTNKSRELPSNIVNKNLRRTYSFLRTKCYFMRSNGYWQTEDGVKRISEARKGTMPVIDFETGESIGSVPIDHPNVKSGKWVHHSRGKVPVMDEYGNKLVVSVEEYRKNKDRYVRRGSSNKGHKNSNANPLTDEELYIIYEKICDKINMIISYNLAKKYANVKIPELRNNNFRFCGKGQKGIHELILSRRKDLPNMIRKGFTKEFKNKNFEGKELSEYVKEKLKNDKD